MLRVLAVEKTLPEAQRLRADLERAGFSVRMSTDGQDAFERLVEGGFDLVLSHVALPRMNGYALCRRVKEDPRTIGVPVILLTSTADPLDVVQALECGADGFVSKPYGAERLATRCHAAIDRQRLRVAGALRAGSRPTAGGWQSDVGTGPQKMLDLLVTTGNELVSTADEVRARERDLIQARAELEQQLHAVDVERKQLEAVVDSVPVPLFVIAPDGLVSHASQATAVAFGTPAADVVGRNLDDVLRFVDSDGEPIPSPLLPYRVAMDEGRTVSAGGAFDVFLAQADGVRQPVMLEASPVFDDRSQAAGCVATAHVVGALTQHDPVTGLPNNAAYLDRAARIRATTLAGCAIMLLELDRFDVTRASIGNATGDILLGEVSRRLRRVFDSLRYSTSSTECFLAYLGGNRFGVILTELPGSFNVLHVSDWVRRLLGERYPAHDDVRLPVSIGVAVDQQAHGGHQLLAAARAALARAREAGGDRVEIFGEAASEQAMNDLQLEIDLRKAVDERDVHLHFQPEVDLRTGRLIGFEALARWQHEGLGAVPPDQFIPLAEESGVILPLGRQLLRQGCEHARSWQQLKGDPALSIAVNISARQLREGFVDEVTGVLEDTGLDPGQLVLELTETTAMSDPESTVGILDGLRKHGVRFSLDDFGTGYSSMAYLTRMRFDQLKLDRGFVAGMSSGGADAVVAQSIVALGQSLDIPVLAEGIERREQAEMLLDLGCEQGQGYLFSRPLDEEGVRSLLHGVRHADYVVPGRGDA